MTICTSLGVSACQSGPRAESAVNPRDREVAHGRAKDAGDVLGGKTASSGKTAATNRGGWSIVLAVAAANAPEVQVMQLLAQARAAGVTDAAIERRGKSIIIATGSYASGADEQAREDLARVQGITINGERPFERAMLSPPPVEALAGSLPEFDLSLVKQRRPKAMYTLQVAVYQPRETGDKEASRADMDIARAAAEKAAVELRREGEEAFYYHGPRRSMVTVGVFTLKDYDAQTGRENIGLRLLHEKYPYNLVNGATLKVRTRGQTVAKEQPSFVVAIP